MAIDFYHGVSVSEVTTGARAVSVPSSSIIGVVASYTEGDAVANIPQLITSEKEAVTMFGENTGSGMAAALGAIYAQTKAVVVAVGVSPGADGSVAEIVGGVDGEGKRGGISALLDAKSVVGVKPRILIAEGSENSAVAAALISLAEKTRAFALIDGPDTTDTDAGAYAESFGSKRAMMIDPRVKVWNSAAGEVVLIPGSYAAAGAGARSDAENGYWSSWSNKVIGGVLGTSRAIDYEYGDESSRANILNNAKVSTVIREDGFRFWGNRTLSGDSKWSFMTRVRVSDIIMDAILAGHQWAIDRGITRTYVSDVTDGLKAFMNAERAKGAIINFDVWVDQDKTTVSEMEQGRVYWNIKFSDVPVAENPNFAVEVTNEYLTEIF